MQTFTSERVGETPDEIWFVEHPPVYTLGMRGDRKHCSRAATSRSCRSIAADRSRITGRDSRSSTSCSICAALASDPRTLVQALESAVIDTVAGYGVVATARRDAPGIYVAGASSARSGCACGATARTTGSR